MTIFFVVVVVRAALWCFSCFLRREAASRAGAGLYFVLCYFFEFGEPEPGRGASRFDCDSVWRVESLLPLVKPAMPVIWPAWILCSLLHRCFFCAVSSMLGHEAYVFGRPSDYFSSVGPAKSRAVDSRPALSLGTRRAGYSWLEGLRSTPGNPTAGYRSREACAEH